MQQLGNTKHGTTLRDSQKRIGLIGIGPGQRYSAWFAVFMTEIDILTTPALAIAEQFELALIQWVKRVSDRETALQLVHIGCSYTLILFPASCVDSVLHVVLAA